jgi:hypothetical protein
MSKYTTEDIADMMRQALQTKVGFSAWTVSTPHLEAFAEMVAQKAVEKEREEIIESFKAHSAMQRINGRYPSRIGEEFLKIVLRRGKE